MMLAASSLVEMLQNNSSTLLAFGPMSSPQKQASGHPQPASSLALDRPASARIQEPPFLRRPVLFDPNSLEPSAAGKDLLKRAVTWLREHSDARILIVGSCDPSGSESCTHALAEARATVIRRFLESSGVRSDQIVGVKGWDHVDRGCASSEIKCKQLSRNAQMFLAGPIPPSKEQP